MLVLDGWVNGIVATGCFFLATLLGLGIIYQARKIHAKLLFLIGLDIFLAAFFWILPFIDFMTIIFTNRNSVFPDFLMGHITFALAPFITLISLYIGAELMIPEKMKYIVVTYFILGIVFEVILFVNPENSYLIEYPPILGTDLIYIYLNSSYLIVTFFYFTFSISGFVFCGLGYLYKSIRTTGIIRKKFMMLSLGYFLFLGFPIFRSIAQRFGVYIPLYYVRIGMVSSFLFFYTGLKEAPVRKEKKIQKKEIKVEESLFRLYEKPELITEEEVMFHREKKICLVCKGKVSRINYICPKCNALYCINCSETLSNKENICWVCNEPIDESKPVKPFIEKIKRKDVKLT
ncbi:MAG: hypothetical protein ACW98X_14595 [Promethearchaeota archaeon]|jgi:hypothetical protein